MLLRRPVLLLCCAIISVSVLEAQPARPSAPLSIPANDQCSGAVVIPGAGPFPALTPVLPDITLAGTAGDPPAPLCQDNVSRSVWYRFTPAMDAVYTFSSCASAPTATTLDDVVLAVYTSAGGCTGPFIPVPAGCDDDGCGSTLQSRLTVRMQRDTVYYLVAWKFDPTPPPASRAALQLRVTQTLPPANDRCGAAVELQLGRPVHGSTRFAEDDHRLAVPGCLNAPGQIGSAAAGRDVVYSFTAPRTGRYSFRVSGYSAQTDAILVLTDTCAASTGPFVLTSCRAAANRGTSSSAEELSCVPLDSARRVLLIVDEHAYTAGSDFLVEVSDCVAEVEPNDTTFTASPAVTGMSGSIAVPGDIDMLSIGAPAAGSRLFALVDAAAAQNTDLDLRVITATRTLEYDDSDNDVRHGSLSPNVAGTVLPGEPVWLRIAPNITGVIAEPWRLWWLVQPPLAAAAAEREPNTQRTSASQHPSNYFLGSLAPASPFSDVDHFGFTADAGDLLFVSLDADPLRDTTPVNAAIALLAEDGTELAVARNGRAVSDTARGAGTMAFTPHAPAEALVYRAPQSGVYFVRVTAGGNPSSGDYLLSISKNGNAGGGGLPADLAVTLRTPDSVVTTYAVEYEVTVRNLSAWDALEAVVSIPTPSGTTFLGAAVTHGTLTVPGTGTTGTVTWSLPVIAGNSSVTAVVQALVTTAPGSSVGVSAAVTVAQPDPAPSNNAASTLVRVATRASELRWSSTAPPDTLLALQTVTRTLTLVNAGPTLAESAVAADTLPEGTHFVSATAPPGWIIDAPGPGTWGTVRFIGDLAVNASVQFTVTARVDPFVENGLVLRFRGDAAGTAIDPVRSNNVWRHESRSVRIAPRIAVETSLLFLKFACSPKLGARAVRSMRIDNAETRLILPDMRWRAVTAAPELTLLADSGREGEALEFTVDRAGLAPGLHTRTITVTAENGATLEAAVNSPFTIEVRIEVEAAQPVPTTSSRPVTGGGWTAFYSASGALVAEARSNSGIVPLLSITAVPCAVPAGISRLQYATRYWTMYTTAAAVDIDVRFYFTQDELRLMMVEDPAALRGWRQFPAGGVWWPTSSAADVLRGYVTIRGITDVRGVWMLAAPWTRFTYPLTSPVALLEDRRSAHVSWSSALPGDAHVLLERRDGDGEWRPVTVLAHGARREFSVRDPLRAPVPGNTPDDAAITYRLFAADAAGSAWESPDIPLDTRLVLSARDAAAPSGDLELGAPVPHPLSASGSEVYVPFALGASGGIELTLHDLLGRHVRTVFSGRLDAGRHRVPFPSAGLAAGAYTLRLTTASGMRVRTLTVVR